MSQYQIIGFTSYDDDKYPNILLQGAELKEVFDEIIEYMQDHAFIYSGSDHQGQPNCVPVFDNGTAFRCSMRLWAQLMAVAHQGDADAYMDYYMGTGEDEPNYPDCEADVPPLEKEPSDPFIARQDIELIAETVSSGMDQLMTFDKALIEVWPKMSEFFKKKFAEKEDEEDDGLTYFDEATGYTIQAMIPLRSGKATIDGVKIQSALFATITNGDDTLLLVSDEEKKSIFLVRPVEVEDRVEYRRAPKDEIPGLLDTAWKFFTEVYQSKK